MGKFTDMRNERIAKQKAERPIRAKENVKHMKMRHARKRAGIDIRNRFSKEVGQWMPRPRWMADGRPMKQEYFSTNPYAGVTEMYYREEKE